MHFHPWICNYFGTRKQSNIARFHIWPHGTNLAIVPLRQRQRVLPWRQQSKSALTNKCFMSIKFRINDVYRWIRKVDHYWKCFKCLSEKVMIYILTPSEIILMCWFRETFLIIIHVETNCAAYYFCWNIQRLLKTKIFCNMNIFTVTIAEFNESLLNKSLNCFLV